MKNIVVIGGGHGLSTIIRGIKGIDDINIKAIVTVADNGGSTGRLRELYNIPAVGDIRNVLVAMSDQERIYEELLNYRFKGEKEEDVVGHTVGNLMLTALMELNGGSLSLAIKEMGKILRVKGRVFPSTIERITLYAKYDDGSIGVGEAHIPNKEKRIVEVYYDHNVYADYDAVKAIKDADLIIYGIGSLYTSILPNTIIKEINDALNESKAKKIYFANCMTQKGETYHYDLKDHLKALALHNTPVDLVIKHSDTIPEYIRDRYTAEDSEEVIDHHNTGVKVIERDLLDFSNNNVRHSPSKIKKVVEELIGD